MSSRSSLNHLPSAYFLAFAITQMSTCNLNSLYERTGKDTVRSKGRSAAFERWARRITGLLFLVVGGYYCAVFLL